MHNRLNRRVILSLALILASSVAVAHAQWPPAGQLRALLDRTSLHRVIEGDPPVTTSLDNAVGEIDFLDRYEPSAIAPLRAQPQDSTGAFHVGPGAYDFDAESYCLHAGTHGPGGGAGYLSAPLQGSKRDAIQHILQGAVAHPEIPQRDIQVLLWAILARTRISDMPRKTQVMAARLLTPAELVELNGGALGMVTDRTWGETNRSLPPVMRRVLETEARLRQMLTSVDTSFDAIERLAVLGGDPAPDSTSRKIREGRWSYHPDGYFIRFLPGGYSTTRVQVYVPEPMTLLRDEDGRLAAIVDQDGERFEVGFLDRGNSRTLARQAATWGTLLNQPGLAGAQGARARSDLRDLTDLAQLRDGIEAASTAAGAGETARRSSPVLQSVTEAWAAAFCEQAGGCGARMRRVDLSETVAVPGHRGRQRLGLSGRGR